MDYETQPTTAKVGRKYYAVTKFVAILSLMELFSNGSAGLVGENQQREQSTVCIEQPCGQAALRDLLEVDLLEAAALRPTKAVHEKINQPHITMSAQPVVRHNPVPVPAPKSSEHFTVKATNKKPAIQVIKPNIRARAAIERRTPYAFSYQDIEGETGNDWSYPNCPHKLPTQASIAIAGLNGGWPAKKNPCFGKQLARAVKVAPGHAEIYVNANNPGKYDSELWPVDNKDRRGNEVDNPYGACHGEDSVACSYLRGVDLVERDEDKWLERAAKKAGAVIRRIWLDAEGGPWQTGKTGQLSNLAVLEGMKDQFTADGYVVGVYAPPGPWYTIVGNQMTAKSKLYGVDEWLPVGSSSLDAAKAGCDQTAFTGGRVAVTQYGSMFDGHRTDADYVCLVG